MLAGKLDSPRTAHDHVRSELFSNRAVRQGTWKLRSQFKPLGQGDGEVFDLAADPAERNNLSEKQPDRVKAMVALRDDCARNNNVVLPSRSVFESLGDQLPKRVPDDPGYPPLVTKRQFVPPKDMLVEPKP